MNIFELSKLIIFLFDAIITLDSALVKLKIIKTDNFSVEKFYPWLYTINGTVVSGKTDRKNGKMGSI